MADTAGEVVPLTAATGVVTVAALTAFVVRLVFNCTVGAEKSVPVAPVRTGFGLAAVLDEGRPDRAVDEVLAVEALEVAE